MVRSQLLIEHQRIGLALDQLDHLLDQVNSVSLCAIIDARWAFARQILSHLDTEDVHVFTPLTAHAQSDVVALATRFETEREALAERFRAHARRFWLDATIDGDRIGYRDSLRPNVAAVRDLLAREEEELYPLIDAPRLGAMRAAGGGRWTADAWRYRAAAPFER